MKRVFSVPQLPNNSYPNCLQIKYDWHMWQPRETRVRKLFNFMGSASQHTIGGLFPRTPRGPVLIPQTCLGFPALQRRYSIPAALQCAVASRWWKSEQRCCSPDQAGDSGHLCTLSCSSPVQHIWLDQLSTAHSSRLCQLRRN